MAGNNLKRTAEQSKRYSFIAEHRGGPLTIENHRKLMWWARECAEHVLLLINKNVDKRLLHSLEVASEWEKGNLPTGEAMKASLVAHKVARQSINPVYKAVARAVGQAVATAHMADHSLGGAFYALKAVKLAKKNIDKEKEWQSRKLHALPPDIVDMVQAMWKKKELSKKI